MHFVTVATDHFLQVIHYFTAPRPPPSSINPAQRLLFHSAIAIEPVPIEFTEPFPFLHASDDFREYTNRACSPKLGISVHPAPKYSRVPNDGCQHSQLKGIVPTSPKLRFDIPEHGRKPAHIAWSLSVLRQSVQQPPKMAPTRPAFKKWLPLEAQMLKKERPLLGHPTDLPPRVPTNARVRELFTTFCPQAPQRIAPPDYQDIQIAIWLHIATSMGSVQPNSQVPHHCRILHRKTYAATNARTMTPHAASKLAMA